jgi:AraC-like DNA-binding protein
MVVELCDALLKELDLRAGVAGKVRQAILARLPRAARFEDVAEDLTINPRTLRRRLSDEHTSYRKLAHELLAAMAIKSLRETDLTVDEIAAALGFSEVGNFRHAFRRWTGMSPSNFRDIRTPRQLSPA